MKRARAEFVTLTANPSWSTLRAVRDAKVLLTNGEVFSIARAKPHDSPTTERKMASARSVPPN